MALRLAMGVVGAGESVCGLVITGETRGTGLVARLKTELVGDPSWAVGVTELVLRVAEGSGLFAAMHVRGAVSGGAVSGGVVVGRTVAGGTVVGGTAGGVIGEQAAAGEISGA